jgi:hypothetical protein
MVEYIRDGETLLAIIIPHYHVGEENTIEFFTKPEYSQQLGYMNRLKDYVIAPHVHVPVARQVEYTQEVLFIRRGVVTVDFYSENQKYLTHRTLTTGDCVLLARGGHGFKMLAPSEIIEVKQGPYTENDKRRF